MLASTALLISLSASAAGLAPATGGSTGDICALGEALCGLPVHQRPLHAERVAYATPAEVDCQAAVETVAVNSRADLQLESGACNPVPAPADYRFHISRLPDAGGAVTVAGAPRVRRSARPPKPSAAASPACLGTPEPFPPALVLSAAQPLALVSTPGLPPPASRLLPPARAGIREGRGYDPPDEPPRL